MATIVEATTDPIVLMTQANASPRRRKELDFSTQLLRLKQDVEKEKEDEMVSRGTSRHQDHQMEELD